MENMSAQENRKSPTAEELFVSSPFVPSIPFTRRVLRLLDGFLQLRYPRRVRHCDSSCTYFFAIQ
jgi:hypothetical protein